MMRGLALLVLALLLSGCAFPQGARTGGGPGGPNADREVEFTVDAAERVPGRCFDGATAFGDVCDRLTVTIDNSAYTNDLSVNSLQWKARDADGRTLTHPDTDGYSEIAGGSTATLDISFTLDDGQAPLVVLIYSGFQGRGEDEVLVY